MSQVCTSKLLRLGFVRRQQKEARGEQMKILSDGVAVGAEAGGVSATRGWGVGPAVGFYPDSQGWEFL